jgi:hypothetical protein
MKAVLESKYSNAARGNYVCQDGVYDNDDKNHCNSNKWNWYLKYTCTRRHSWLM